MRSGQVPLKLECFAFKENGDKEKLGYVLLNIRSAQVMCQQRKSDVKASWHKLLGLRSDLKIHKPELLLTLKIEDKKSSNINSTVKVKYNTLCSFTLSSYLKIKSKQKYKKITKS